MSLIHEKVTAIADDPAFDVGSDEWNAEHKFPGAGAGEVVFVDGSGHAATSADLTFDDSLGILTVAVGVKTTIINSVDATVDIGLANAVAGELSLNAGGNFFKFRDDDSFDMEMSAGDGFFGFGGDTAGNAFIDNTDVSIQLMRTDNPLGQPAFAQPAIVFGVNDGFGTKKYLEFRGEGFEGEVCLFPTSGMICDIGSRDSPFQSGRFTNGYFASNVDAATFSVAAAPGIDATVTTAGLVGKTLTFVKGICTGFA